LLKELAGNVLSTSESDFWGMLDTPHKHEIVDCGAFYFGLRPLAIPSFGSVCPLSPNR